MQHVLTIDQLNDDFIQEVFQKARTCRDAHKRYPLTGLSGRVLACLFYEPSTRTSSSFIAAMARAGGSVIPITQGVQFSSVSKGESLEDTIVTLGQYADAIVLRHPDVGSAARAAAVSPVPIINAGDGVGEHPTQALLDLFTIEEECGIPLAQVGLGFLYPRAYALKEDLSVTFLGDLKNGRTVHSLVELLLRKKVRIHLISPILLPLPAYLRDQVLANGGTEKFVGYTGLSLKDELRDTDVVYMTRVQKERFSSTFMSEYRGLKDACILTPSIVAAMKPTCRILHPLPRVNEIPREIDSDPRAVYFKQVQNGMWVRMALLMKVLQ